MDAGKTVRAAAVCALVGAALGVLAFAFATQLPRSVFGIAALVGLILLIAAPILIDGAAARFAKSMGSWSEAARTRFTAEMSRAGTVKNWGLAIALAGAVASVADTLWHTHTSIASAPLLIVGILVMAVAYFSIGRIVARG